MQTVLGDKPFYGCNRFSLYLNRQYQAGIHQDIIQQHTTCAAVAVAAAFLGADQPQIFTEYF